MSLIADLESLIEKLKAGLAQAELLSDLEELRVSFMGRKGQLAAMMAHMKNLSAEERPAFGQKANQVKEALTALLDARTEALKAGEEAEKAASFDPTLPGRLPWQGSLHPITLVMNDIIAALESLGYEVVSGPEVETDFHCFEALNFPKDHPARDMQDTLYINEGLVMRTHTSPMQVRSMLDRKKPPLAVIAPGKVYRRDSDLTHTPMFHQIEGLLVDKNISLADLRGTLAYFVKKTFREQRAGTLPPQLLPIYRAKR